MALDFASEKLRNDKEIALTTLQNNLDTILNISSKLQQDQDIQKAAGFNPDINQEPDKPDIDTVLGDARKWCQEHNDTPTAQPQHNIER